MFFCKGTMKNAVSNYMVDLGNRFIIIKDVPCHKCDQCGEISYSGEVVAKIEETVNKLKEASTKVAIINFAA
ncbi:MAG: type II toxin-antitoxin system MqsA family antitoxin [Clostridia bacterium]|nr:type II toxin-antitoxin system MqsA family antitoxin [Clostridia bacterium]